MPNAGQVAVFGDSIAWGSWDVDGGGWVQRLKREYMQRQVADPSPYGYVTVCECAVPGHRVSDIRKRVVGDLESIDPQVVIVAIGINDAPNFEHRRGTPKTDFERDYAFVLDQCSKSADTVICLSATKIHERWLGWQNGDIESINESIIALAEARNINCLNVFDVLEREHVDKDGVHPNGAGHQIIFETVLAHLDRIGLKR